MQTLIIVYKIQLWIRKHYHRTIIKAQYYANVQKTLFQVLNKTMQVYTIKIPELKKLYSENVDVNPLLSRVLFDSTQI